MEKVQPEMHTLEITEGVDHDRAFYKWLAEHSSSMLQLIVHM